MNCRCHSYCTCSDWTYRRTRSVPRPMMLCTEAPIGQRLDCGHLVRKGAVVHPVQLEYRIKSSCGPSCALRMLRDETRERIDWTLQRWVS